MPTATTVDGVVEVGHVLAESFGQKAYLVVVDEKQEEVAACLDLFLPDEGIEFQFHLGVGDVYDRELLSVVACGRVAYGLENEAHVIGTHLFAFVAAYAAPLEEGFFDALHDV